MDNVDEVLEPPVKLSEQGFAVRLTHREETGEYRVEYSNLVAGEVEEDWNVFGGSVGYNASSYDSLRQAEDFYDEVQDLSGDQILDQLTPIGTGPVDLDYWSFDSDYVEKNHRTLSAWVYEGENDFEDDVRVRLDVEDDGLVFLPPHQFFASNPYSYEDVDEAYRETVSYVEDFDVETLGEPRKEGEGGGENL